MTVAGSSGNVQCENGHANPVASVVCGTCGVPVLDLDTHVSEVVRSLRRLAPQFKPRQRYVLVGIGEVSSRVMVSFLSEPDLAGADARAMLVEPSRDTEAAVSRSAATARPLEGDPVHHRVSVHKLPGEQHPVPKYAGAVEQVSRPGNLLADGLRRIGLRGDEGNQGVFLAADIATGVGAGAGPYLLDLVRDVSKNAASVSLVEAPSADDEPIGHFNAFYGLSRLLGRKDTRNCDAIILMDEDRLMQVGGVGSRGREIRGRDQLPHLIAAVMGSGRDGDGRGLDIGLRELASHSRAMDIQIMVPCLAIGRSMEIFGTFSNILESAVSFPLAQIDASTTLMAYLMVRVPSSLQSELTRDVVEKEFNRWAEKHFPLSMARPVQVFYYQSLADRVDALLLLGGADTGPSIQGTRRRYEQYAEFLHQLGRAQWQEYGLSPETLEEVESVVDSYHAHLSSLREVSRRNRAGRYDSQCNL